MLRNLKLSKFVIKILQIVTILSITVFVGSEPGGDRNNTTIIITVVVCVLLVAICTLAIGIVLTLPCVLRRRKRRDGMWTMPITSILSS